MPNQLWLGKWDPKQNVPVSISFDKVRILKTKMQIQIGFEEGRTRWCITTATATATNIAEWWIVDICGV